MRKFFLCRFSAFLSAVVPALFFLFCIPQAHGQPADRLAFSATSSSGFDGFNGGNLTVQLSGTKATVQVTVASFDATGNLAATCCSIDGIFVQTNFGHPQVIVGQAQTFSTVATVITTSVTFCWSGCTTRAILTLSVPGFVMASTSISVTLLADPDITDCDSLDVCKRQECLRQQLVVNTGYDQTTGTAYGIGDYDAYWNVISDPFPGTTEPRPASAILGNTAWDPPGANSQWIAAYPSSINPTNGLYQFENCFCVCESSSFATVDLTVLADDSASVYLNGIYLGSTNPSPPNPFQVPTHIVTLATVQAGVNCLRIDVNNTGNVAMGLNVTGAITAPTASLLDYSCCVSTATILGQKFNDVNCDGILDSGDTPLSGWTVTLSNGQSTTTDLNGFYYFHVSSGTYTIAEQLQPGWTQTFPNTATYTLAVSAGNVYDGFDFLNCPPDNDCMGLDSISVKCVETTSTGATFKLSFVVTNNNPFGLDAHDLVLEACTSANVLSSNVITFNPPLGPGQTSALVCVELSGPGIFEGNDVCIKLQLHSALKPNGQYEWCCPPDTLCFTLPECRDCCEDLLRDLKVEVPQGPIVGSSTALVQAQFSGFSSPITSFSATVVSATLYRFFCPNFVTVLPACANISDGTLSGLPLPGPQFPSNDPNLPTSSEAFWGTRPCGENVSTATVALTVDFQPPPEGTCPDAFRFCVRYAFTDTNCITCDTLICYVFRRLPDTAGTGGANSPLVVTPASIHLDDFETGILTIDTGPETATRDQGYLRATGFSIAAEEGVRLLSLQNVKTGEMHRIVDDTAFVNDLVSGNAPSYRLHFDNPGRKQMFCLYLRYSMEMRSEDEVQVPSMELIARTPALRGGDILNADSDLSAALPIRTYALYFVNANRAEQDIGQVTLTLEDGTRLLAVGPYQDSASVSLRPRITGASEAVLMPHTDTGADLVAPGDIIRPLYITVAGAPDGGLRLKYKTHSVSGETLTEDYIHLRSNGARQGGIGSGHSSGIFLAPVYPNPASSLLTVQFNLRREFAEVSLAIKNIEGRDVSHLIRRTPMNAGDHAVTVNVDHLATGSYFMVLETESGMVNVGFQIRR